MSTTLLSALVSAVLTFIPVGAASTGVDTDTSAAVQLSQPLVGNAAVVATTAVGVSVTNTSNVAATVEAAVLPSATIALAQPVAAVAAPVVAAVPPAASAATKPVEALGVPVVTDVVDGVVTPVANIPGALLDPLLAP